MNVHSIESMGRDTIIIVTEKTWFGFGKEVTRQYRGSGTVWRDAQTGQRCSTWAESILADVWTKHRWETGK